jgi:peptide-methionine (R)-S-oxide reductase
MINTTDRNLAESTNTFPKPQPRLIGRRAFIAAIAAIPAIVAFRHAVTAVASDASNASPEPDSSAIVKVSIVEFTDSGQRKGLVMVDKVVKTDAEWRKELTP